VHALADSRHNGSGQIESCIQHFFRNSVFPGVRQASVDSWLTVSNDGDRNADQMFFSLRQQFGRVGVVIVLAKVCSFFHGRFPFIQALRFLTKVSQLEFNGKRGIIF
jgi:hypothetical protein